MTATTNPQEAHGMFAHHTDRELLTVNAQYLREYREDPTEARLHLVNESSRALSARGL